MAKNEKIDVYNRSGRTYTTPSGVHLQGEQTTQLDREEAETMLKSYPRDLISPDALRSSPSSQSDNDRRKEIERLQGIVEVLETDKKNLQEALDNAGTKVKDLNAEVDRLNAGIIEFLKQDPNNPAPGFNPVVVAAKSLQGTVHGPATPPAPGK